MGLKQPLFWIVTLEIENNIVHNKFESNNKQNGKNTMSKSYQKITKYFSLYSIFQAIGIFLVLSVFFWLQIYRNGIGFTEIAEVCNWHPLLMIFSFIYLFANTILHFRNFRNAKKRTLKIQHAIIHSCVIIIGALGIWAGLNSNLIANPPIPKFYSLHSWLGIVTIIMFFFQFVCGFVCFLYPEIAIQNKKVAMPYHILLGILIFALSIVTSILGFSEKIIFALNRQYEYMPAEGLFLNFLGIVLLFYGILVIYILINPKYKRVIAENEVVYTET